MSVGISTGTLVLLMASGRLAAQADGGVSETTSGAFKAGSSAIEHPAAIDLPIGYGKRHSAERVQTMAELAIEAMAMDAEEILSLIDDKHGLPIAMPCPACGGFALSFDLAQPRVLSCDECRTEVSSAAFPATGSVTGPNRMGESVAYGYHEKDGKRYFIEPRIRFLRHHALADMCRALAYQYHVTGDEAYAARAAALLHRFAAVYGRWPVVKWATWDVITLGPTRPYDSPRVGCFTHRAVYEIPLNLLVAYDLTYSADAWASAGDGSAEAARRRVEEDLFGMTLALTMDYTADLGHLHNLQASQFLRMIHLGRVLNRPGLVHRAVQMMEDMVRVFYHFDGMEYEGSASYHGMVTGRLSIAAGALKGYTDPPGYVDEQYGMRFEEGVGFMEKMPVLERAWHIARELHFPNGVPVPIHDTAWPKSRRTTPDDAEAKNIELNAFGHMALARGQGPDAMQAHLHFCPDARAPGHAHDDRLSLILWTAGEELLSDMGYVHSGNIHQYFAHNAINHNTVTASFTDPPEPPGLPELEDRPDDPVAARAAELARLRPLADARSSLLAYAPGVVSGKRVQLVEASSPGPSWRGVTMRRRALLLIAVDENRSYLVDLFRIAGGDSHQFVLRPSLDEDVAAECSLPLTRRGGTLAGEDIPYGEGVSKWRGPWEPLIHDLRSATTAAPYEFRFLGADSQAGLRCFFRGQPDSEVLLAQSPSMRRAHNDNRKADAYQGPHLLVRRTVEQDRGSLFGAVYDGWREGTDPLVERVTWHDLEDNTAAAAVAVSVQVGSREDLIYTSLDSTPRTVEGNTFAGQYAVLSRRDGKPAWAWGYAYAEVQMAGARLRSPAARRFPLVKVLRRQQGDPVNGFEIEGQLDAEEMLQGQWLRILFGNGQAYGYCIEKVEPVEGGTRISIRGEPGFQLTADGASLLYHPFYDLPGSCEVEIVRPVFAEFP